MDIHQAITEVGKKASIMKSATIIAKNHKDYPNNLVSEILEQYHETEGNKIRMDKIFGSDVMDCIVKYANNVNYAASIELTYLQCKEEYENNK